MANTLKYKDSSGNVQTVNFDPTYAVRVDADTTTTEWSLITDDPVVIPQLTEYVGGRPKDRS